MGNEMFQARLPDDFAEEVHEYRESNYMSKSEAVRHLLRRGLEAEAEAEQDTSDDGGMRPQLTSVLDRLARTSVFFTALAIAFFGLFLIYPAVMAYLSGSVVLGAFLMATAIVTMLTGSLLVLLAGIAQYALYRPLRGIAGFSTAGGGR